MKKSRESNRSVFTLIIFLLMASLFFVVGCKSGSSGDDLTKPGGDEEVTEQGDFETTVPVRENTVYVGSSSFPIGVPNFPREDNQTLDNLGYKKVARAVRRIATNELYTFPETPDPQIVKDTLKYFIDAGHQVLHEIHIINGPGMRNATDKFINGIKGRNVSDEEFTNLLWNDTETKNAVLTLFNEVVVHAKALEAMGVEVYICPELEDNQDVGENSAFGIYLHYLQVVGWTNPDGSLRRSRIVRNGGSIGRIQGIRYEYHPHTVSQLQHVPLRPGDFVNMDGTSFWFNSDENRPSHMRSEDDVRQMIQIAEDRNLVFYFWDARTQGLNQPARFGYVPIGAYDQRSYLLDNPVGFVSLLLKVSEAEAEKLINGQ